MADENSNSDESYSAPGQDNFPPTMPSERANYDYGPQYSHPGQTPPGYGPLAPGHPQETTVLIVGILGLLICQIASPFAWSMGRKARREIKESNGQIRETTPLTIGYVLGIVGTALLGLIVAFFALFLVLGLIFAGSAHDIIKDGNYCISITGDGDERANLEERCQDENDPLKGFSLEGKPR